MRWRQILSVLIAAAILATALPGCGFGSKGTHLTVLAGSELKDLEPLFDDIAKATGITLDMTYIGSLEGAEALVSGERVDLAWFSHAKYLSLLQGAQARVAAQERIMLSPVVLGVRQSLAEEWGWVDNANITWQDIVAKAGSGQLRYAMTNPASSNSGFSALVGAAAALSGSSDALAADDVDAVADDLRAFFSGQVLTSGSSGWLADRYVEEQGQLDGIINYESVLLELNESGDLQEPLCLVYPNEGIITADYPLLLINAEVREQFDTLVDYLRTPEVQKRIMETTLRRPSVTGVALSSSFPTSVLVELPFPSSLAVVDKLLFSYLDEQRVPAHAYYVLDVSGSMEGEPLENLKAALDNLTGVDTSLTGQFARFRDRERLTLMPFSSDVIDVRDFTVSTADVSTLDAIRQYVDSLAVVSGTAMYSSLRQAYELAAAAQEEEPDRYYSIVLMSDGQSNEGISEGEFMSFHSSLPEAAREVRTFTILFGSADEEAMQAIADETGGRMFDARSESLAAVLREIRGYQ